jgi:sortase A
MRDTVLRWFERGLLAIGTVLAIWCAVVLVEARFTQNLPVPEPPLKVTQILPGEDGPRRDAPAPAAGAWLGRLEVPSLKMSATVLEGSDDATLRRGAGHLEDTPLPGQSGNMAIAGHRDTVFRPLKNVRAGDALDLTTTDRIYHYRVSRTLIVGPRDVHVLDPTSEPTITLVTCYPFEFLGHAPQRFIVQAQLVREDARASTTGLPTASGR